MFLPGGVPKGGAVRLFESTRAMGVAEGIETALSDGTVVQVAGVGVLHRKVYCGSGNGLTMHAYDDLWRQ